MAELKRTNLGVEREKCVLVGVILPGSTADPRDPLGELASLVATAGGEVAERILQKKRAVDAGTYVGSGKAEEIARSAMRHNAECVVFDNELTPGQIGALEKIINQTANSPRGKGIKVIDRSELILDIFAGRAQTAEAKLQVELAQMEYTYPRLTRMWGHLERIAGGGTIGIGTRGPGEPQLEIDRRLVRKRVGDLKASIAQVQNRKTRTVERRNREHYTVCIVGYTNAGKSTLFNTLTAAGTYADDKLFATLDTKTRSWRLERGLEVLLSDTVGFVRDLPHNLVASFKATLEEATTADLLLHVLDIAHPRAEQQYTAAREVLDEIGAGDKPELLLLNKTDTDEGREQAAYWRALHGEAISISAKTGAGLAELQEKVYAYIRGQQVEVTLRADVTDGRLLAFLESHSRVQERQIVEGQVEMTTVMGRRTLLDVKRNEAVQILAVKSAAESAASGIK